MRNVIVSVVVFVATGMLGANVAGALDVGDAAPELAIKNWVKGTPVSLADAKGKNVVVVEFWATWCGPCRRSIPHLSRLQAEHKKDGLLVVGISKEKLDIVKSWLADNPDVRMDYHVAVDTAGGTYGKYMKRGMGIPYAYVVDKTGTIAWHGYVMLGADYVAKKVLVGTYDLKKGAQASRLQEDLQKALQKQDAQKLLRISDQLIALQPDNPRHYDWKVRVLGFQGRAAELLALRRAMAKTFHDDAEVLRRIAHDLTTPADLARRDLKLAMACARRAVELTSRKHAETLGALARVYGALGLWDRAVAVQTEAIAAASKRQVPMLKPALEYYRSAKALAAENARD